VQSYVDHSISDQKSPVLQLGQLHHQTHGNTRAPALSKLLASHGVLIVPLLLDRSSVPSQCTPRCYTS